MERWDKVRVPNWSGDATLVYLCYLVFWITYPSFHHRKSTYLSFSCSHGVDIHSLAYFCPKRWYRWNSLNYDATGNGRHSCPDTAILTAIKTLSGLDGIVYSHIHFLSIWTLWLVLCPHYAYFIYPRCPGRCRMV